METGFTAGRKQVLIKTTGKRFRQEMREEAFGLYCREISGYLVARELVTRYGPDDAPSRETVQRWAATSQRL